MYLLNKKLNKKIEVNDNVGEILVKKKRYEKITQNQFFGIEEKKETKK